MKRFFFLCLFFLSFMSKSLLASELIRFPNDFFTLTSPYSMLDYEFDRSLDSGRVSSPPKEYFSINTVYLRNQFMIHMGKDLINGNYVIMPSPNILSVEPTSNKKKTIKIQQYFPDLEAKLMEMFALTPTQIHSLYITSYRVIDQSGKEVQSIYIPENVHYRPPMTMTFDVDQEVKVLSFLFSFTSRTAWADSGLGSDLSSIYRDLRHMDIDRDARLYLKIDPENNSEIYEVYNSEESQKINQILSELHQVIIWGDMPNREEIIKELLNLKTFQFVSVDLKNLSAELAKYPHLFGNPTDPKWISKFEKIKASKFREEEITSESSGSLSLGLDKIFSFGGSSSKKRHKRLKEIFEFEMEGDFYVPKAIKFSLRADNSLTMLKTLTFQAYKNLEEKEYFLGVGVEIQKPSPFAPKILLGKQTPWVNKHHQPSVFNCPENQILTGVSSRHTNRIEDRLFKYRCGEVSLWGEKIKVDSCHVTKNVNDFDRPVNFSCPAHQVLVGESSHFHRKRKDRRFSYSCCSLKHSFAKLKTESCSFSPWVNAFDAYFDYKCPENMVLKGVKSYHKDGIEDRRFSYQCCSVKEVQD